jgi:hypothetical protein
MQGASADKKAYVKKSPDGETWILFVSAAGVADEL